MSENKTPFAELGLSQPLLNAVARAGYELSTPIQAAAIPVILTGRDLIGCAQTGTGKTAAFTLPMLDRLLASTKSSTGGAPSAHQGSSSSERSSGRRGASHHRSAPSRPLRALVLSPTRELAAQIGDSLAKYGKGSGLRHVVVYGGVSQFHQVKALRGGVDSLIATPGRLLDLKNQGHIDLSKIEVLVFDEADQMLDMGFLPDLKRIVAAVPAQRQTLMFSATMPDAIRQLAQQWLRQPEEIQVAEISKPADKITQSVHLVDKKRKPDLLSHFLKQTPRSRTLVFSRTKHGADKIVKQLTKDGLHAAAIHGNKSQGARNRALAQFKSEKPPVLVATDIAARGLDIRGVSHVINYDLPETPETYVHRIGRTARAGAEGIAVSFCAGDERGLLKQIERLIHRALDVEPVIEGFEPTEPVRHDAKPRRGGGGGRPQHGGNRSKAASGPGKPGKPRRPRAAQGAPGAQSRPASAAGAGGAKPRRRPTTSGQSTPARRDSSAEGNATTATASASQKKRRPRRAL
ncbi:DEAD/DEAH box helicase [Botrimarina hoheduenensis]|uniref:ATP-dependent RNA helicase RhlE n=1 Tax=Botrimarina hoheduenensis TaxID=2528000 RepID=A0A5C5VU43_9BACT|nr:DEAD/DEAH box helicase [Botrimarina hoheduenensis]TWT41435.1 ATP-dependent RNA helicase RhlE [Botrimarina hoheduenensis]